MSGITKEQLEDRWREGENSLPPPPQCPLRSPAARKIGGSPHCAIVTLMTMVQGCQVCGWASVGRRDGRAADWRRGNGKCWLGRHSEHQHCVAVSAPSLHRFLARNSWHFKSALFIISPLLYILLSETMVPRSRVNQMIES